MLFVNEKKKFWLIFNLVILLLIIGFIPMRLTSARLLNPKPQAIFMLGGGNNREIYTAQFAQNHPNLPIWISSGIPVKESKKIFEEQGINLDRVNWDLKATDTVTNFTTLVDIFKENNINHVYLITSAFHMERAKTIAYFVFGSRGIAYTTVSVSDVNITESNLRIFRDAIRSVVWIFTGRTGANLGSKLQELSYLFH
ncbi:MAG: YdcF family protein [Cyanobacterium sp. T60_A2020_053]|nr:YdcF family protein [Cyanobacterium sp. T60_A2020_053]